MGIFSRLQAAILPEVKEPTKLPSKPAAVPKYLGTSKGSKISNVATNTTSLDRSIYARGAANINAVVANLVRVSPDLSHAVATKISTIITKGYTAVAYDETGLIDEKGTELAQALLLRWNTQSYDYSRFTRSSDLRSLCSSLILDSIRYGGMMGELVLGPGRVPSHPRAVAMSYISWADNTVDSYPIYAGRDGDIPLNFPTIFYSSTQQDMETPYSESPLQTAIQPALWDSELQDHLRKAAHKNLLQRLVVTINSEEWVKTLPLDVQNDQVKRDEAAANTVAQLEAQLERLNPEDSLVIFSTLEVDTASDANRSEDKSIQVLTDLISGQLASGSKILPAILGRGASSGTASTESMLFLNSAGFAQLELNIMISRMLTLAVKLLGQQVSVVFKFDDINLKPTLELESFKMVKQARVTEQLSLGFISDIEASIELTGSLPPKGYKNLSGTMFKLGSVDTKQNSYSNTSATADGKTDSNQATKETTSDAPTGVAGKNP
jgi:hypothetical protein